MMNLGENSDSIPTDLIFEIFSRLPTKSIGRFRCVSKQWGSMLCSLDFTELFLTRSSAHPRLLFALKGLRKWSFYSSPQPQNPYEKSSLVVAADIHMKFSEDMWPEFRGFNSGLIYFSTVDKDDGRVICNPITGQYAILPELKMLRERGYTFLGFDPIDKQFKVFSLNVLANNEAVHHILTLGTGIKWWKMGWRKIKCPLTHEPLREGKGICINRVLYYLARKIGVWEKIIVCFDVRFEKFKIIDAEFFVDPYATQLVNYKGKLGVIELTVVVDDGDDDDDDIDNDDLVHELRMWVLKDVENHKWLKYVYTFPENEVLDSYFFVVVGVTARGEIVLSRKYTCQPFYVLYFNPERNTLQCVEIHGNHEMLKNQNRVYAYVDFVEDLNFNIRKTTYAATSISPLEQKRKLTSTNKFDALSFR